MTHKILDKGSLKLVESWGSDERVCDSARVSIEAGMRRGKPATEKDNIKIINYMANNGHTSPFEHCGATFYVKAPIFVYRQWHRHRTQSYNEVSGRYSSEIFTDFYLPTIERLMTEQIDNRQGEGKIVDKKDAMIAANIILESSALALDRYNDLLKYGTSKELARLVLPVNVYSQMYVSSNLWNWVRFLKLRTDEHAQYEIRQYAMAIYKELKELFPKSIKAFFPDGV